MWGCPTSVLALPISNNEKEHRGAVKGCFATVSLALLGLPMPTLRNHQRNDPGRKRVCSGNKEMLMYLFLFKVSE